jgi:hypothetical protein
MHDPTWIFQRGAEKLELQRSESADGLRLMITGDGPPRSYQFVDLTTAVTVQSDMESFLLKTGWSFGEFRPERRSGTDRRQWPRIDERRRWWTDGLRLLQGTRTRHR